MQNSPPSGRRGMPTRSSAVLSATYSPWIGSQAIASAHGTGTVGGATSNRSAQRDQRPHIERIRTAEPGVPLCNCNWSRSSRPIRRFARCASAGRKANRHHASITDPVRIGELLRAMDGYVGHARRRAAALTLGAFGICTSRRATQGRMGRDQFRQFRVAHSCRAHEGARIAHRSTGEASHCDPARVRTHLRAMVVTSSQDCARVPGP